MTRFHQRLLRRHNFAGWHPALPFVDQLNNNSIGIRIERIRSRINQNAAA